MGFIGNIVGSNLQPQKENKDFSMISLDLEETSYILRSMKTGTFKGEELEKVFNLVVKLQEHYTNTEKND
tara:strand:+ start:36 stop:245 length:210 start_codon:yes stop_codon:yes gene_type:complete